MVTYQLCPESLGEPGSATPRMEMSQAARPAGRHLEAETQTLPVCKYRSLLLALTESFKTDVRTQCGLDYISDFRDSKDWGT